MMDDLISRTWLLSEYDKRHKGPPGGARKLIEEAPSAQPDTYWKEQCQSYERTINKLRESLSKQHKIIRCNDCRYYNSEEKECLDLMGHGRRWEEDDFCSYAERREVTT